MINPSPALRINSISVILHHDESCIRVCDVVGGMVDRPLSLSLSLYGPNRVKTRNHFQQNFRVAFHVILPMADYISYFAICR